MKYQKLERLKEILKEAGNVAVAFSGGVDSVFLLKTAHDTLGEKAIAITAQSLIFPKWESNEAEQFCQEQKIRQIFCRIDELSIEGFAENPKDRCYICKKELFRRMQMLAEQEGISYLAEGSHMDDLGDYRPGMRAIAELGIKSPLRESGLTKLEIRQLSKEMGLSTWEKPSYACLASRFVYGEQITAEKLAMVEQAEEYLMSLGFRQMRVRMHGQMARIEVLPEAFSMIMKEEVRQLIQEQFTKLGFSYVTLDLKGFRSGSMNEVFVK